MGTLIIKLIFCLLALLIAGIVILGVVITIYDNAKLKEENNKLKEDLQKARMRRLKSEYKKVGVKNGTNNKRGV